ncbi:MAG: bifunctional folylpolyglutamate synthase/dihydrofolate synthase [Calditrichaeota bacterium]|nr:bifunctional folylpolyglutamate synthase/dihydrofolate synthase [Calditrichota bacterium]
MPNPDELIDYLFSRRRFGLKPGLQRVQALLEYLGHPERKFDTVHIAGTNGKGTTAAFLEGILRAGGLKTGLYTSPHLVSPEERVRVDWQKIPRERLVGWIADLRPQIEKTEATFFEAMTAIGFAYFAETGVDVAVVEVGLGGRWDATNVVTPKVAVVTDVHLDHQRHLGRTLGQIAAEKAGILKPGVPCVTYVQRRAARVVLEEKAREVGAELLRLQAETRTRVREVEALGTTIDYRGRSLHVRGLKTRLVGEHQGRNLALALLSAEVFGLPGDLSEESLRQAVAAVRWDGRFQVLAREPLRLVDVAHNIQGVRAFVDTFRWVWGERHDVVFALGLLRDKPAGGMFDVLSRLGRRVVVTPLPSQRSADVNSLADFARQRGWEVRQAASPVEAWQLAEAWAGDEPVVGLGSHYLVGDVLRARGEQPP